MLEYILAIDPGNVQSAFVLTDALLKPLRICKSDNEFMYLSLCDAFAELNCLPENTAICIEWVKSYGQRVGDSVFETVAWAAKFEDRLKEYDPERITRMQERMEICHSSRANDAAIRRTLIDRFAKDVPNDGKGTKKAPGWFHGFRADIWQAYAVACTYAIRKGLIKNE